MWLAKWLLSSFWCYAKNGFVPGSVTAPHRTDSIIRLNTRDRPGERFFVRARLLIRLLACCARHACHYRESRVAFCARQYREAADAIGHQVRCQWRVENGKKASLMLRSE